MKDRYVQILMRGRDKKWFLHSSAFSIERVFYIYFTASPNLLHVLRRNYTFAVLIECYFSMAINFSQGSQ